MADGRQTPGLVSCGGPGCPRGCSEQDTGWPGLRPAEGQLEGCCLRLQGQQGQPQVRGPCQEALIFSASWARSPKARYSQGLIPPEAPLPGRWTPPPPCEFTTLSFCLSLGPGVPGLRGPGLVGLGPPLGPPCGSLASVATPPPSQSPRVRTLGDRIHPGTTVNQVHG